MSAFGHAGFGSTNRRNQLRAQGQIDPYGNQVRQAKQAPTFNIYSQQSQPAPSSRPATPRPQPASMPAYGGQPQTGGPMPTMGQAQPAPSSSTGTPYQQAASAGPTQGPPNAYSPQAANVPSSIDAQNWLRYAVSAGDPMALHNSGLVNPNTGAWIGDQNDPAKNLWDAQKFSDQYAAATGWNATAGGQWAGMEPIDRRTGRVIHTVGDPRADIVDWDNMTFRPNPDFTPNPLVTAYEKELAGEMPQSQWNAVGGQMPTMGQAQPIQPASTGTPYAGPPRDLEPLGSEANIDPRTDAGFAKWSGYQPGQARSPAIERMEKAAVDQWRKWTPAQRAAAAAGVGQQRYSPEYATQLEAAYGDAQKQQESTDRFNEIQGLRRQLAGGTAAQDDDILYRLNTLEGGPQTSREDFIRQRQAERDNAPMAAQYKDREKFIDEWMQEQKRAGMSPDEYQQSRQRTREFDKPLGTMQNDPYLFAGQHRGNPATFDAEMARRFNERQSAQRNDVASQQQFLAGWQGPRPFEEWYAQRYGGDAKQKWGLL